MSELKEVFLLFCRFGDKSNPGELDGKGFTKLCKDTGIINGKTVTATDADLTFAKHKKGLRKIDFKAFSDALGDLAKKRFPAEAKESPEKAFQSISQLIIKSGGPSSSGTVAEANKFHDDKSLYTGVYKAGGPTNVDKDKITLSSLADRTPSDARGRKAL